MRRAGIFALPLLAAGLFSSGFAPAKSGDPAPEPSAQPPAAPAGAPELEAAVRALTHDHVFKDAQIGIAILDVDTGRYFAVHDEHAPLNPASNAKVYTAAAALAMLHGSHRYQTSLSGTIRAGAVASALVLRGHGDPSLRSSDLWAMAQDLKSQGVKRIDGDLVVDQRFYDELTTPPAFDQQPNEWAAFRAPVSAVALNENTITLTVRPGAVGGPALASFDPPGFVDVDGAVKTAESGADTVGLALEPRGKRLSAKLSGAIGQDSRVARYTRRVDDPTLLAGYALRAILEDLGIKVAGEVKLGSSTKAATPLVRHESEPLGTLLYALGKSSDNFYAEMIFKSIAGEAKGHPARSQDSAELVTKWLENNGCSDAGIVIKNGSGLFDANRVTAASVVQLLRHVWRDPGVGPEFVAQLAIGGQDGTLHGRFRAFRAHQAIRAKTGTLDDTIALSGYVLGPPGKGPIAFSIVMNHVAGKGAAARAAADTLVGLVHEAQWGR